MPGRAWGSRGDTRKGPVALCYQSVSSCHFRGTCSRCQPVEYLGERGVVRWLIIVVGHGDAQARYFPVLAVSKRGRLVRGWEDARPQVWQKKASKDECLPTLPPYRAPECWGRVGNYSRTQVRLQQQLGKLDQRGRPRAGAGAQGKKEGAHHGRVGARQLGCACGGAPRARNQPTNTGAWPGAARPGALWRQTSAETVTLAPLEL